jgi:hypothetical protein
MPIMPSVHVFDKDYRVHCVSKPCKDGVLIVDVAICKGLDHALIVSRGVVVITLNKQAT